jgi:hypothetical protein
MASVVVCGAGILCWSRGVEAQSARASGNGPVPATECCLPLLFAVGARSLGLGSAVTARSSSGALFANPALVAELVSDEFVVHTASTSLEKSNTFSLLIRSDIVGTIGLSYRLIDHGDQEARDANGNPIGTISIFEQVLTATYATRVAAGLNAGVSYELFQFRQDCRGFCGTANISATTHGLGLGVQYRPRWLDSLELGGSIVHLGFPLQVINAGQASPLPLRLRLGAAYELSHHLRADTTAALWVMVDVVASPRGLGENLLNIGSELSLDDTLFLWAGYASGSGLIGGPAVGVGLKYDRFDVGVAKSFVSSPIDESEPLQVTFGIRF